MCSAAAEWLVPWDLSPLPCTPQLVKETLQWVGSWERQQLSEGVPQQPLKKRHWITRVMLHLILTRILRILGSLTRNKKRQWRCTEKVVFFRAVG